MVCFEVKISPQQKRKKSDDYESEDTHESCLILAPFNKCPTVNFNNVKLGTVAERILKLINPSHVSLEVKLLDIPERKCGLSFSTDNFILLPSEKIFVNISWAPIEHGSWHHTVKVTTDKRGSFSFRIVCSSEKIERRRNVHKALRDHNHPIVISKKVKQPWVSITRTKPEDKINCRAELNVTSKQNKYKPAQNFDFTSTRLPHFSGARTPRRDTYSLKNVERDEGKENILDEKKFKLPFGVKGPKSKVRLGSINELCLSPLRIVHPDNGNIVSNTSVLSSFDNKLKGLCFTPDSNIHKNPIHHGLNQNSVLRGKRHEYSMCSNTVKTMTTNEWYNGNDSVFSVTKTTKIEEFSFSLASTPIKSGSSSSETFDDSLEVNQQTPLGQFDNITTQIKCNDEEVAMFPPFCLTKRDLNTDFDEQPWGEATSADLKFDFESLNVQPVPWPPDADLHSRPKENNILKLSPIQHSKMDFKFSVESKESDIRKCRSKSLCELVENKMNTTYLLEQEAARSVIDEAMEDDYNVAERTVKPATNEDLFNDFNFSMLTPPKLSKKQVTDVAAFDLLQNIDVEASTVSNKDVGEYEEASTAEEQKETSHLQASRSPAVALYFSPPKHTVKTKLPTKRPLRWNSDAQMSGTFGTAHKRTARLSLKKPLKSPLKVKRIYESSLKSGVKHSLKESRGICGGHVTTENIDADVIVMDYKMMMPPKKVKCEQISNTGTLIGNLINTNASVSCLDPFLARDVYYDQQWVDACERQFIKWLNSLLTPPATLACDFQSLTVDVVELWKQTSKQQSVNLALNREVVSSLYNTNERLNSLRKTACLLFKSNEVAEVLSKVAAGIEKQVITIRDDKALLQDIGLKQYILKLLLSYNPLWLRIGLETVYGKTIALSSNSDVQGITAFLIHNFLEDSYLKRRYNHSKARHMFDTAYVQAMRKFILKKFFSLVYFLDRAKETKLIGHDPCLFNRNAVYKSSREILLAFSREFLSAIGDITKCLRHFGYFVTHVQSYLNEFDYAVTKLLDLRDGVRLCRVMEIILRDELIMSKLRVPALSRLQKVHNVGLAFASLKLAGFDISGNISPHDIVDGHREKTLSLLWQILLKYQLPKYEAAAVKLQHWWRRNLMRIKLKNIRKIKAAVTIQQNYRAMKLMKYERNRFQLKKTCAVVIQKWVRKVLPARKQRNIFIRQRKSALVIQRWWRATLLQRQHLILYYRMVTNVLLIQRWYRSVIQMRKERASYQRLCVLVTLVQQRFRSNRAMKQQKTAFQVQKAAARTIQTWIRTVFLMRKERTLFLEKKHSTIIIQQWYRNMLSVKLHQHEYQKLKKSVRLVQQRFRANRAMKQQKTAFQVQKAAARTIQSWIKAVFLMRKERALYLEKQHSAIIIQQWYRNMLSAKLYQHEFQKLRVAVIHIQRKYRATLLMKSDRNRYRRKRWASVIIQRWFRATLIMKHHRVTYLTQRNCIIKIQRWFRNVCSSRKQNVLTPISHVELENCAAVKIQALWRGFIARKHLPNNCLSLKNRLMRSPSQPGETLRRKYTNNLRCFEQDSLGQMIMLFMSLNSLTDLSKEICRDFSASEYLSKVFRELQRANRSFACQRLCSLGTQLVLNLAKYQENRDNIWQVADGLDIIFQLMTQSVGTQSTIFSNCCKILWLLADDPLKSQVICGSPQSSNTKRLLNFYNQELKKVTSRRPSSACGGSVSKASSACGRHPVSGGSVKIFSASRRQGPVSGGSVNKLSSSNRRQCLANCSSVNKRTATLSQLDSPFNCIKYLLEKLELL